MLTQNYNNTATASVRSTRVIALLLGNLKSILAKAFATAWRDSTHAWDTLSFCDCIS